METGTKLVYKAPQESQSPFNIGCLCLVDKASKRESETSSMCCSLLEVQPTVFFTTHLLFCKEKITTAFTMLKEFWIHKLKFSYST